MINYVQNKGGLQSTLGRRPTHEEAQQLKLSTRHFRTGEQRNSPEGTDVQAQQRPLDGHGELRAFNENRDGTFDNSSLPTNVDFRLPQHRNQIPQQNTLQEYGDDQTVEALDPRRREDQALDYLGWESGLSDPAGDDDAQIETDKYGYSHESQALYDIITHEVESMKPQERQKLGLESRLANGNGQYARSYPSTTSGHIEEQEEESTQTEVSGELPVALAVGPGVARSQQNYVDGASSRLSAGDPMRSGIPTSNATSGFKRKAREEFLPVQASSQLPIQRSYAPSHRVIESAHEPGAPHVPYAETNHRADIPMREDLANMSEWEQNVQDLAPDPVELDYEPSSLHTMNFSALSKEPFDKDPRAELFVLQDDQSTAPLETRLDLIARQPAEDQQRFFASLTLTEWEDAGDWFSGKFQDVTSKLKLCRRARREMAEEFEEEIAKRYRAVTQETESIAAALKDMKAKGTLVLSPEKKRS